MSEGTGGLVYTVKGVGDKGEVVVRMGLGMRQNMV